LSGAPDAFLPYGRHDIDEEDVAAVAEVLRGDWLTTGPKVEAFERALAEATGARHAVVCNSATAGLHLSMMALGIGEGDAVIVPSVTFLATANCVRYVGGEVIFADVDPRTGLMTADTMAAAAQRAGGRRLRAAIPVHLTGRTTDMAALADVAEDRAMVLVEDAAHAIGSRYKANGRLAPVGDCRFSRMAVFSFHPVKTIAMGEGGAVTTNDNALQQSLAVFRSHGMTRDAAAFAHADMAFDARGGANPWYYEMAAPGFNYRATDMQCALGLSQLRKLDRYAERRRKLVDLYRQALAPLRPIVQGPDAPDDCAPAWHLCVVRIDFAAAKTDRAAVMAKLRERGIGSQVHYIPVHHQPYYRSRYGALNLPGADAYYARCLSLPLFPAMADSDVDRVVAALAAALGRTA
jgi:UDP-4-amino-4,6-dideoxy-N-acetyl-beta-L-altrosamine transaminase